MEMHNPPHPGELVREAMGDAEVTAFAEKLSVSRVTLSRLLNGKAGISAGMALSLSEVLGTSAEMWMGLQTQYDLWHARQNRKTVRGTPGHSRKVCPECGHKFQGNGWDGIDAHWRARHAPVMSYEEAWPLISAGKYVAAKSRPEAA
jgi:addiction module HigA family antidote